MTYLNTVMLLFIGSAINFFCQFKFLPFSETQGQLIRCRQNRLHERESTRAQEILSTPYLIGKKYLLTNQRRGFEMLLELVW